MVDTVDLLGTRHNTDESISRVEEVIRDREPDIVGVELPPRVFDDGPEWSLSAAFDPREPVTLPGLLLKRRLIGDGDLWDVEEMFVAARVAADVGATVALIDRPFADSLDQGARALAADVVGWLRLVAREVNVHRERFDDDEWGELLDRDVWKFGEWASPYVEYARALRRQGASNLLDADEREAAARQLGSDGAELSIDLGRTRIPRVMATHIDQRDACMAGHLRWVAKERTGDVLGIVAKGHLPGVAERLNGERALDERLVAQPAYADPDAIPDDLIDSP